MKVPTILIVGVLFAGFASASQAAFYGGGNQPARAHVRRRTGQSCFAAKR